MKKLCEDLWQSKLYRPFSFLKTQSYLLCTDMGNALLYNTGIEKELDEIERLGGISSQYLTHRHESGKNLKKIKERFNSTLFCEITESEYVSKDCDVDIKINELVQFENNVIAIPTPGHTSGGCCYYYESPHGGRYLFTGDLFYVDGSGFSTFVYSTDGGSQTELIKSLLILKEYEPSLVLSSAFGGKSSSLEVSKEFWVKEIERNINSLR